MCLALAACTAGDGEAPSGPMPQGATPPEAYDVPVSIAPEDPAAAASADARASIVPEDPAAATGTGGLAATDATGARGLDARDATGTLPLAPHWKGPVWDGFAAVLVTLGAGGAFLVALHSLLRLRGVSALTRLAWIGTAFFAPLIGPALYLAAYRHPQGGGTRRARFSRPPAIRAAAAAAAGFGFAAPLLLAAAWLSERLGGPDMLGPWTQGAGRPPGATLLLGAWAAALLFAWACVRVSLRRNASREVPRTRLAWRTLGASVFSATAVAAALVATARWMSRLHAPAPREGELPWLGVMAAATLAAFLLSWLLNYPLARVDRR